MTICCLYISASRARRGTELAMEMTNEFDDGRKMRSFQLYRKPVVPPNRFVGDYAPAELAELQRTFQVIAAKYRQHRRWVIFALVGFVGSGAAAALFQQIWIVVYLGMPFLLVSFAAMATAPPLVCPGCDNSVETIGRYCPECGLPALDGGTFIRPAECTSCGKILSYRKGFKIRACGHCGIMLDEMGV